MKKPHSIKETKNWQNDVRKIKYVNAGEELQSSPCKKDSPHDEDSSD